MKIIVLGAGVIGVTTAYYLKKSGHEVTVLEKGPGASLATSYANGGQLSYSYSEPLANPSLLPKVPGLLLSNLLRSKNLPFYIKPTMEPELYYWLFEFMRNCSTARTLANNEAILRLALRSRDEMHKLLSGRNIEFDYRKTGKLHIFDSERDFMHAAEMSEIQNKFGCGQQVLLRDQCIEKEPAIAPMRKHIAGGVFSPLDESGDVHKFTAELAKMLAGEGVEFRYNTEVTDINFSGDGIEHVSAAGKKFTADAFIVALGPYSAAFCRKAGISIPVYPLKGYSITVKANFPHAPKASVTDNHRKIVYTLLGDRLRIAGIAELAGYDHSINKDRIESMVRAARESMPEAGDYSAVEEWTALRPATPGSVPIIGKTKYRNLYLNTGHGMLGWTLACGSAAQLAEMVK